MTRGERYWRLQRVSGLIAMFSLFLALAFILDGLRTGIFGSSDVRLVPGEEYAVSGPMPPKTDNVREFVIEGGPMDGSVRLIPENVFTGYWLGGGMWRGRIVADSHPQPGIYVLKVRDKHGEKQNPALIFTIRVFADEQARRAQSPSLAMRWTGVDGYLFAALFFLTGGLCAIGNYLLGRRWRMALAEHGCGEIFRVRIIDGQVEIGAELPRKNEITVGARYRFTHPKRGDLGQGWVTSCTNSEVTLRFEGAGMVRPGDIACPLRA